MNGMLKMAELAERSGVSTGTIKHYLREGLLGAGDEIMRTSRNMAWYPPELVDRIRLIKQLQEDRYLPLRAIREVLTAREGEPTPHAEVEARHALPANVLDRLEELGIVTCGPGGYRPDDVAILAAIRVLLDRLAGEVAPDRAAEIVAAGAEPLCDLVGVMHSKLLLAELERTRGRPGV